MKIVFCVEFYWPSVGGAQEVVRQIAERMVLMGHSVTVATSRLSDRSDYQPSEVQVVEFAVAGNLVNGLRGEVDRFRSFLLEQDADLILFYAAQQWTFDAAWQIFDRLTCKKVVVPCGYSALFDEKYREYFCDLPNILRQCDALVYHASESRDVEYAKANNLTNGILIPNGADLAEFDVPHDSDFYSRNQVAEDATVILTVGTLNGAKGHLEVAKAYKLATFGGVRTTLILNGNVQPKASLQTDPGARTNKISGWLPRLARAYRRHGFLSTLRKIIDLFVVNLGALKRVSLQTLVDRINTLENKMVVVTDLDRTALVQAYLHADLFVFASKIEYSPLVLFEAAAAGTPFLSVPVGNAREISQWTNGGRICPAATDRDGFTRVDPWVLAREMETILSDQEGRRSLAHGGREAVAERYNWNMIADEYDTLFRRLIGSNL